MDEVIFEEFKGTGNSEVVLSRHIAERRIYPAMDLLKSGTRKEELLIEDEKLKKIYVLRSMLHKQENETKALQFIFGQLKKSKDNDEFFAMMNEGQ